MAWLKILSRAIRNHTRDLSQTSLVVPTDPFVASRITPTTAKMSTNIMIPNKTAVQKMLDNLRIVKQAIDSWNFRSAGYREYGMYNSDLYNDDNPQVAEAVRRLPEHVYEARVHRLHRAMQLSRNKIVLPNSMWAKEDDPLQNYLEPYLKEVQKEIAERAEWNKK